MTESEIIGPEAQFRHGFEIWPTGITAKARHENVAIFICSVKVCLLRRIRTTYYTE